MAWKKILTTADDSAYKNTNVPNQTLSISGQDVTLSNSGGTITIPDTQDISLSGNTITLVNGGTLDVSTATAVAANSAKVSYPGSASAAELNLLDGASAGLTTNEINFLDGVTSAIQTQIDTKQATISLTANRALTSHGSGGIAVSDVTDTELGYLDGVSSNIQTQLNAKQASGTYYTDSLNSNYWNADANRGSGSSGYTMDFAGNVTVSEVLTVDGASTLTGAVTIGGNLTVNGTTTTISTANLEVEDKDIVLGTPDSAYADNDAAASGASGGGISLYTDSSGTTNNFAKLTWSSTGDLTGWHAEDTQTGKFPIAMMEFSSDSSAPDGDAAGVGSFHFDSGNDSLYIRTS